MNHNKFSYPHKCEVLLTYIKSVHNHSIISSCRNHICSDSNGLALWFEQQMTVLNTSFLTLIHARTIPDHISGCNIISKSKPVMHRYSKTQLKDIHQWERTQQCVLLLVIL
jgi:hypothetical protein